MHHSDAAQSYFQPRRLSTEYCLGSPCAKIYRNRCSLYNSNEDDVAFVWRAADVEDMFLLAGLLVPRYLEGAVLMLLNQKELLRFCRHLPTQVCYYYFIFHLLKLDGCGKPKHLEHYPI